MLLGDRLRGHDHCAILRACAVTNVRESTYFTVIDGPSLEIVEPPTPPGDYQPIAIRYDDVESGPALGFDAAAPFGNALKGPAECRSDIARGTLSDQGKKEPKNVLAVGGAPDFRTVMRGNRLAHPFLDLAKGWNRPIMNEGPRALRKGVRVGQVRLSHCSSAHMGQDRMRKDPRRGALEMFAVIGCPGLTFDLWAVVLVGGDSPAVGMPIPGRVSLALAH